MNHQPHCRTSWLILPVLAACGLSASGAVAQDLTIVDLTPAINFDDTSTVSDGREWTLLGVDDLFRVFSDEKAQILLNADNTKNSLSLGLGASATGVSGTALGDRALTTGNFSTALGFRTSATGALSTAVGYRASAPIDNTIVLGRITGVNSASDYANVAIGTTTPQGPLHIFRDDDSQALLILESDEQESNQDRALIDLSNNGGIRFEFDNQVLGTAWRFQAATGNQDNFEVTKVGTGTIEFKVDANGNATLAGLLFENSDRNAKTNIEAIDPQEVLARVAQLPISEWEYSDTPGQRHVGPMAQDFRQAFGLGANDTSLATIDTSGVALASIKALNQALEEKTGEVNQLKSALDDQRAHSAELEARLALVEDLLRDLSAIGDVATR